MSQPSPLQVAAGWKELPLSDLYEFKNGVNADKGAYGRGVPFINVLEPITYSHLRGSEISGLVSLTPLLSATYEVRAGDLVFNRTSEIAEEVGLSAVYLGSERVVFGGFVIRGRPLGNAIDSSFAAYALRAPAVRSQIVAMGQGAVRANIGQDSMRRVVLRFPNMDEQHAISQALTDADALIDSLGQLLTKKRQIKQGAMQELLTGKRRLPGFHGLWESKRLDQIADIRSGGTPSTKNSEFWDGQVLWCTTTDITALRGGKWLANTARTISDKGVKASSAEILPTGTIVMTTRATIGECAIAAVPLSTNQGFKNLVPQACAHGEFVYYLLATKTQDLLALCAGSTFLEIGKRQLASFEVRMPRALDEQRAIAEVLSDMDADLEATESRLSKARDLKQAMAQALLTGRIRLVEPQAA